MKNRAFSLQRILAICDSKDDIAPCEYIPGTSYDMSYLSLVERSSEYLGRDTFNKLQEDTLNEQQRLETHSQAQNCKFGLRYTS